MQTLDNLDGRADAEFRELGTDAERSRAKSSKHDIRTGREVPKDKDTERTATGVLSGSPGPSLPESNSKQSAVDESEFLQCKRNQSRRNPEIEPDDHGLAELSNDLWSSIGRWSDGQASQHDAHSEGSTSGDECEVSGRAPVRVIDGHNLFAEKAEIDRDGEILSTASSEPSGHDSDSALVTGKTGKPITANGARKESPSPGSIKQDALAHDETGEFLHVEKTDSPRIAVSETGIADQSKLAPLVRNVDAEKSKQASEPKQQDFESGREATEVSSSFSSPVANSSGSAEQAFADNEDVPAALPHEEPRSEQVDEQLGSEVPKAVEVAESDDFGNDASNNLTVDDVLSGQEFDAIAERVERRDNEEVSEKLQDLTEDDNFAALQSPDPSTAAMDEDDQCISANLDSHSSPSADAGNSGVAEETPKTNGPVGAQVEDNSRRGCRIAARILAFGTLVSACIFASKQFGATAWLIENALKIQAQYSLALPDSSNQPSDDLGSLIELIGDVEGRDAESESELDSERRPVGDIDSALRIAEGIKNAPAAEKAIGNVDSGTQYLAKLDGEVAAVRQADRSSSERTYASTLEPSEVDGMRNAPSENRSLDGASRLATVETGSELVSAGAANPADMQSFKPDAAIVERNSDAAIHRHAASSGSGVTRAYYGKAAHETDGDIDEGLDSPLRAGVPHDFSDYSERIKPRTPEPRDYSSEANKISPSENSASPHSDKIVSFDLIPDASGEAANATVDSSTFDDGDRPNSADLSSIRSELESEFAKIHSRFDLMAARFDLLFSNHEPSSAVHDGKKTSGARLSESHDDTNVASEMNCQHSPDRSGQSCGVRLRASKGSQPYLIATAQTAEDGEFVMPKQGYGSVLDVLRDGASGWLVVMENATIRLD